MLGLTSVSVFLFSALALAVSSGYSLGAVILLVLSVGLLWKRPRLLLDRNDYRIIGVLLVYFVVYTANMLFHQDPTRELDMPSRTLLAVPALLLMLAYPPRAGAWWGGVAIGAIGGTLLASWQFVSLDMWRPVAGTSNAIHYGNVSMLLGLLSMCGIEWARQQRHAIAWTTLLVLGFLAGVGGSILSGSRGGWLALPICVVIFALLRAKRLGYRSAILSISLLLVLTTGAFILPHSPVRERTETAIKEFQISNKNPRIVDTSVGERLQMWSSALKLSTIQPLFGLGRTGYLAEKVELTSEGKLTRNITDYTNAHNDYIDALVKRGIIGLLCLLALLLVPLATFARALRHPSPGVQPYALGGIVLCTCYLIFGLTTTSLTLNIGIIMLAFPMVILWAMLRQQQRKS